MDHDILLSKLEYYGKTGPVQEWFRSYLNGRMQTFIVNSCIDKNIQTSVEGVLEGGQWRS